METTPHRISAAESEVMKVLWTDSPKPAEELLVILAKEQGWAEGTVKTLLNRLLKKGAIAADKDGRRFLYRPLIGREDYVDAESRACWTACSTVASPRWSCICRKATSSATRTSPS